MSLGSYILDYSKNGEVYSFLYKCESINKAVHVDFIKTSEDNFNSRKQYYRKNKYHN